MSFSIWYARGMCAGVGESENAVVCARRRLFCGLFSMKGQEPHEFFVRLTDYRILLMKATQSANHPAGYLLGRPRVIHGTRYTAAFS